MPDKVQVRGKVTWVGRREYNGRQYWRVGLLPEGEDSAIFLNVGTLEAPGKKGDVITLNVTKEALEKARKTKPVENQEDGRIIRSVAIKAAADAVSSIPHSDVSTLIADTLKVAAEFEYYIRG